VLGYIINDDKNVIVANYSGEAFQFSKNKDGSLAEAKQAAHYGREIPKDKKVRISHGSFFLIKVCFRY
jgi:hypothetical protein